MSTMLSIDETAELFAVTAKTIRAWIALGMPVVSRGAQGRGKATQIDLAEAVRWYFSEKAISLELNRERTRLARAQADRAEMELAVRGEELCEISVVTAWYGRHIERCRSRLIALPDALANFCPLGTAALVVPEARRILYEAMAELAVSEASPPQHDG